MPVVRRAYKEIPYYEELDCMMYCFVGRGSWYREFDDEYTYAIWTRSNRARTDITVLSLTVWNDDPDWMFDVARQFTKSADAHEALYRLRFG